MTDAARFRVKRFKYAVTTALWSKVMTAGVQLLALPIAIRALGDKQFALYAMLASALGWLSLANMGIGPVLVVSIAEAAAQGDRAAERRLFTSALVPILSIVLLFGVGVLLLTQYVPIVRLFGPNYQESTDVIRIGGSILAGFFLFQCVLSVVEAAQSGYQEQYILNLMTMLGNMVCILTIISIAKLTPSVISMILAVNAPPLIFRLVNAVRFFANRSYLAPSARYFSWLDCRFLLSGGMAFSLAGGLGSFLCHQFPVILVGRLWGVQDAASFAIAMNVLIIASGMISTITVSLWPAISDSMARGEVVWAQRSYSRMLLFCMAYSILVGIVFAVLGNPLFRLWFGPSVHMSRLLMVFLGLYFILLTWENIHFAMLIGFKKIAFPSILYLLRSIFSIVLMLILSKSLGLAGPFVVLCISVAIFSLVPLTRLTGHILREGKI